MTGYRPSENIDRVGVEYILNVTDYATSIQGSVVMAFPAWYGEYLRESTSEDISGLCLCYVWLRYD